MNLFMWLVLIVCVATVVYAYVGYAAIVWVMATVRSRRRPDPLPVDSPSIDSPSIDTPSGLPSIDSPSGLPSVTLIIAAYNEEDWIEAKLDNTAALDYPRDRLQVIVAASGSTDRTADLARAYGRDGATIEPVVVTGGPRAGKMAALNEAMAHAEGEIVVFSDANNRYDRSAVAELVAPFSDPTVGCVSGSKVVADGDGNLGDAEGLYWRYESWLKKQETAIGCCTAVAGEIMALRRDLFEPAPARVINDDFYMAMRIVADGHRVSYVPAARSIERVSVDEADEVRRRSRIVAGRYQAIGMAGRLLPWRRPLVAWQIVSHKFLRPLIPLFMIGALVSNLWLAVTAGTEPGWPHALLLGQMAFYAAAWLGGRLRSGGLLRKLLYVPRFLVSSNLAALLGLFGYLTGGQSALWAKAARRGAVQGGEGVT